MAMTVMTKRFSGRTFNTQEMRTVNPRIALRGPVPCAADAVFAEARAFLSSDEARQMSVSDLERELHRRRQELVRKLLQEHCDRRSPREAGAPAKGAPAGTVEGTSGVECPEGREHECHTRTTSRRVLVPRPGCASRRQDGPHSLDTALNLPLERHGVEVCRPTTIATATRASPCTPLSVTAALDIARPGGRAPPTKKSRTLSRCAAGSRPRGVGHWLP